MNIFVVIDFNIEGFHRWDNAFKECEFLKSRHRHIFQIKVLFQVKKADREIEIFQKEKEIKDFLKNKFGDPSEFQGMSCEEIAILIYRQFNAWSVEVLEDGRGGALVK